MRSIPKLNVLLAAVAAAYVALALASATLASLVLLGAETFNPKALLDLWLAHSLATLAGLLPLLALARLTRVESLRIAALSAMFVVAGAWAMDSASGAFAGVAGDVAGTRAFGLARLVLGYVAQLCLTIVAVRHLRFGFRRWERRISSRST